MSNNIKKLRPYRGSDSNGNDDCMKETIDINFAEDRKCNYFSYQFFHRLPTHKLCFLSCRPFVVNATFSTGLVVPSVSCRVNDEKPSGKKTQLVSGTIV